VHDTVAALGIVDHRAREKQCAQPLRRDGIVDVIGEANFAPTVERASSPTRRPHAERATHLGAERVGWRTHSKRRGHPNSRDDGLVSGLASLVERGSGEARRSADRTS